MSREMNRAKIVPVAQGPVRKLLVAGGGDWVHVVALDAEGRTLAHVQLGAAEADALARALAEVRRA